MKIQVIRKDGSLETLTLTEPLTIVRGEGMNRLVTSTGMEHWFTEQGIYDGWGMRVQITIPEEEMNAAFADGAMPKSAENFISEIDRGREFPDSPQERKP